MMPMYEYENEQTRSRIEIFGHMRSPPPERMFLRKPKSLSGWLTIEGIEEVVDSNTLPQHLTEYRHERFGTSRDGSVAAMFTSDSVYIGPYRRVYSASSPIVKDYGIQYPGQKLPVSRVLPLDTRPGTIVVRNGQRVREHADGTTCDLQGRRIIATRQDVERAEAQTGYKRD